MTIHIGLLRAVNLPGHNKVAMSDLCQLLTSAGMQEVRSLLQSGNVIFQTGGAPTRKLEQLLETTVEKRLGVKTDFFVRTASEWEDVVAGNPFPAEARRDPGRLHVMFLKEAVDRAAVAALQKAITGREIVRGSGRQAYIVYPDGIGRSRLSIAVIEKKLGTRATGRNWNTVLKIGALTERP